MLRTKSIELKLGFTRGDGITPKKISLNFYLSIVVNSMSEQQLQRYLAMSEISSKINLYQNFHREASKFFPEIFLWFGTVNIYYVRHSSRTITFVGLHDRVSDLAYISNQSVNLVAKLS